MMEASATFSDGGLVRGYRFKPVEREPGEKLKDWLNRVSDQLKARYILVFGRAPISIVYTELGWHEGIIK